MSDTQGANAHPHERPTGLYLPFSITVISTIRQQGNNTGLYSPSSTTFPIMPAIANDLAARGRTKCSSTPDFIQTRLSIILVEGLALMSQYSESTDNGVCCVMASHYSAYTSLNLTTLRRPSRSSQSPSKARSSGRDPDIACLIFSH